MVSYLTFGKIILHCILALMLLNVVMSFLQFDIPLVFLTATNFPLYGVLIFKLDYLRAVKLS